MMLSEVYGGQAEDMRDALSAGPVVLSGVPGSCRAELTADLHPASPRLELRTARAGTAAGLRVDTARALLRFIDQSSAETSPRQFRALLAEFFGGKAQSAVAAAKGTRGSAMSFAEIIDGVPPQALVVVYDAHLLAEPWAERALWTLRARCQERDPPRLILLTRPWHASALTGREAAFFGFGETFELTPPDLPRWVQLTDYEIGPDDIAWLLEQTRSIPRPTLAAVERLHAGDVRAAWAAHVGAQRGAARWIDRLAHGLHPYGPRLLTAIAGSEPVYPSVPEARTDAIAAALRAMRDHDLIYQPVPRRWVVADPALVPHLIALSRPQDAAASRN
jgi:hypothetical protein